MTEIFGVFHIIALIATCALAFAGARMLCGPERSVIIRCLFTAGLILAVSEVYKQVYIFREISHGAYDWWYFPFQLCSVPMYLCLLLPLMSERLRDASLNFMSTFTLISTLAALIYPEDFLRPQIGLTIHGFLWHGLLLFISLLIIFSGAAEYSMKNFARSCALFVILCAAAVFINMAAEPLMLKSEGITHDYAAMFYMNPYHISPQPIVGAVQEKAGIAFGLFLYACSVIGTAGIINYILSRRFRGVSDF